MIAMDNATTNASDMVSSMQLKYNRCGAALRVGARVRVGVRVCGARYCASACVALSSLDRAGLSCATFCPAPLFGGLWWVWKLKKKKCQT